MDSKTAKAIEYVMDNEQAQTLAEESKMFRLVQQIVNLEVKDLSRENLRRLIDQTTEDEGPTAEKKTHSLHAGDVTVFFFTSAADMDGEFASLDEGQGFVLSHECRVIEVSGDKVHLECDDYGQDGWYTIV